MTKEVRWIMAKPLDSDEQVVQFEKGFAVMLPETFKRFVVVNNNAKPVPYKYDSEVCIGRVFESLISFSDSDEDNMFDTIQDLRAQGFPGNLIPLAIDPFGNYICFDCDNNYAIVFWNHETGTIEFIADSFCSFIDMLYK